MSQENAINTIRDILADSPITMLTTQCEKGHLHACPMTTLQTNDQPQHLWFLMSKGSKPVQHMQVHPQVNLAYQHNGDHLSISGSAKLLDDQAKVDELWHDTYNAFFNGAHDPDIQLVCIEANHAHYWSSNGKINAAYQLAKAALTGEKTAEQLGDSQHIKL